MSVRGSKPKIASGSLIEPASLPSRVVIFISMSRALLHGGSGFRRGRLGRLLPGLRRGIGLGNFRHTELSGFRRLLGQFLFDRVAHGDPATLGTRHRTLDQDEAALDVGLHNFEIERGDALDAKMARHLLVLERLAGVLPATGAADRTVRNRHAVRSAQAGKIPALHATSKSLAAGDAADVDELARYEVVGCDLGTDRDEPVFAHPEFGELALGLNLLLSEITPIGLDHVIRAARTRAQLPRDIAVLILGPMGDHLALRKAQHRHRYVLAGLGEHPGHSDLLCDDTRTHC